MKPPTMRPRRPYRTGAHITCLLCREPLDRDGNCNCGNVTDPHGWPDGAA